MNSEKDILIVLINYKNNEEVVNYVQQVNAIKDSCKLNIVIVDNASTEDDFNNLNKILMQYNFVDHISSEKNLGYMNGFLFGLDYYYTHYGHLPYWTIISNSDIKFTQADFFLKLAQENYGDDIWCVGPSVVDLNGNYCNPHYKERISLNKINRIRFFMKSGILCRLYFWMSNRKKNVHKTKEESCYVYSVHGCFMILKNDFYFSLKGEKYGVLLYSEESYIAEQLLLLNKKAYYDSHLELFHYENVATGKLSAATRGKRIYESLTYIKEHFYDKK